MILKEKESQIIKANELVEKFTHGGMVNWEAAKKDAVICCQEIIDELEYNNTGNAMPCARAEYYKGVKQQLSKI